MAAATDAVLNGSGKTKVKKEKRNKSRSAEPKRGGKGRIILLAVGLPILLIICAFLAVLMMNPAGLRDKYLADRIANVPVLNRFLPDDTGETDGEEIAPPVKSSAELLAEIDALTTQLEQKDSQLASLRESVESYRIALISQSELARQMSEFNALKNEFNRDNALKDTKLYQKYFEQINPETAADLYREAVGINQSDKEVKDYLNKIKGMDTKKIAKAMEDMINTNMELIIKVLKAFDVDTASEIMNEMSATNAAAVMRQMRPEGF